MANLSRQKALLVAQSLHQSCFPTLLLMNFKLKLHFTWKSNKIFGRHDS